MDMNLKVGDKVKAPRTGGGYSEGTILSIHGGRAITEFPIGKTFQGRVNDFAPEDEMAIKNVALDKLIPIKEELFNE